MTALYPPSPTQVPETLSAPSAAYKRQAVLAVLGLLGFLGLYLLLVWWLAHLVWRGVHDAFVAGGGAFLSLLVAVPAAFLLVVMVKGLFAVKRFPLDHLRELDPEEEPELLAFVHRVADETGARRPARIFLSDRVNAAVFYDAGLWNLIVPTRKNLEIGLGLVNVLSLDEFKAVVAHEFGHFAQRSMGIGSWVYLAQQLVGDLVSRRDALDRFLEGLSYFDLRVAWVGWIMRLIVWALRSVVDQAFRGVVMLNRALSRQMELQADLVSVRVSGSDSLCHALHRLSAADQSWTAAANFTAGEAMAGRAVEDLFAVQTRLIARHAEVHDQPDWGCTPERPAEAEAAAFRVFRRRLAEAPRMWATHPPNHEREANAKATYIPSVADPRSAWELFADPEGTRREATRRFVARVRAAELEDGGAPGGGGAGEDGEELVRVELSQTLAQVDAQFDRPHLQRRYQGLYTSRGLTRLAAEEPGLIDDPGNLPREALLARIDALYPHALSEDIALIEELGEELGALEALRDGFLEAPGGVIVHRGRQLRRRELPEAIAATRSEWEAVQARIFAAFREARGVHLACARAMGSGWEAHLRGLLGLVHYAEHAGADLEDAGGHFRHVVQIVLADGRVSKAEVQRTLSSGEDLQRTVQAIYAERGGVRLGAALAELLEAGSWAELLPGELGLFPPSQQDLATGWIGHAESWVRGLGGALGRLGGRSLDLLVEAEAHVERCFREGLDPGPAPKPVPARPPQPRAFTVDMERPRQKRLGWWDRFQLADGPLAGAARTSAAAAVLAPAFFLTWSTGLATVVVYNGLQVPVEVRLGDERLSLGPEQHARVELPPGELMVEAHTAGGQRIETFGAEVESAYVTPVYNVARAAPLVRWTATYGARSERPPQFFGPERWHLAQTDHVFEQPPEQIETSSDGGTRTVTEAVRGAGPLDLDSLVTDPAERARLVAAHARFDASGSPALGEWLAAVEDPDVRAEIFDQRMALAPEDTRVHRLAMDLAEPERREALCDTWSARAADQPASATLAYLHARCLPEGPEEEAAWARFRTAFGEEPWARYARFWHAWEQGELAEATRLGEGLDELVAYQELRLPLALARLRRMQVADAASLDLSELEARSPILAWFLALERRDPALAGPLAQPWWDLEDGLFEEVAAIIAEDPAVHGALTVLYGASEGAPPEAVAAALAVTPLPESLPAQVAGLALALREGGDAARWQAGLAELGLPETAVLALALEPVALAQDPARIEAGMACLSGANLPFLHLAGVVLLGEAAPAAWRQSARSGTFLTERPHLRPLGARTPEAPLE